MARRTSTSSGNGGSTPRSRAGSGVFGAGTGTMFLQIAQTIKDPTLKQIAIHLAPSVAVVVTALTIWLRKLLQDYVDEILRNRIFNKAERVLSRIINDPHASSAEKEQALKDWDAVQKARREAALQPILRPTTK